MSVRKRIGSLGIVVSMWLASASAAPPASGSAQERPAAAQQEQPAVVQARAIKLHGALNPGDADARHCLQHTDNLKVIRCAEPFLHPPAAGSSRQG